MNINRDNLLLYAVTDHKFASNQEDFLHQIEDALEGGVTLIQLREKSIEKVDFINEAILIKKICQKYNVPLIINDNFDVALKSGADGVHLGADDEPVSEIRKKAPSDFIIGATCKTVEQAQLAEKDGADYIGIGAIFLSTTKQNAVRVTMEELKKIASSVSIPSVAIGGICISNIFKLRNSGISGIAVISAIFGNENIRDSARDLKKLAREMFS